MSTVDVTGVTKRYGSVPALSAVTTTLDAGVIGLLGPNGAGKTTLLRILATVLAPDTGQVRLLGHTPSTPEGRAHIRRRLGYVPQEPGFHDGFSAFDFVDYVAILKEFTDRSTRHAEVRRVLELVGLSDHMNKKIRALSGGMRRRVGIAQAFLGDPDLLLLDEPTAGLDPEQRLLFREVISQRPDRTIVISTHQTEDVAALCGRVLVLTDGLIAFDGTPRDLAGLAAGRVWLADAPSAGALASWRTGDGQLRCIGDPPKGATTVEAAVEDGYLLLLRGTGIEGAA